MPVSRASVSTLLSAWQSRSSSSTRLAEERALATRANSSDNEALTCEGMAGLPRSAGFPVIAGKLYEEAASQSTRRSLVRDPESATRTCGSSRPQTHPFRDLRCSYSFPFARCLGPPDVGGLKGLTHSP